MIENNNIYADYDNPHARKTQIIPPVPGALGVGIPDGGTTGQLLAKESNDDGDVEWIDAPESGTGFEYGNPYTVFKGYSTNTSSGATGNIFAAAMLLEDIIKINMYNTVYSYQYTYDKENHKIILKNNGSSNGYFPDFYVLSSSNSLSCTFSEDSKMKVDTNDSFKLAELDVNNYLVKIEKYANSAAFTAGSTFEITFNSDVEVYKDVKFIPNVPGAGSAGYVLTKTTNYPYNFAWMKPEVKREEISSIWYHEISGGEMTAKAFGEVFEDYTAVYDAPATEQVVSAASNIFTYVTNSSIALSKYFPGDVDDYLDQPIPVLGGIVINGATSSPNLYMVLTYDSDLAEYTLSIANVEKFTYDNKMTMHFMLPLYE